jgi:hypothetical protein
MRKGENIHEMQCRTHNLFLRRGRSWPGGHGIGAGRSHLLERPSGRSVGYSWTGTIILPTGAIPAAAVGTFTADAAGDLSGTQTSSLGGVVAQDMVKGTVTVNSDCTATMTVGLYDHSGNLLRTAVWAIVYVDDAREARAIFTSLVLPNGMSLPTIGTANAKRLFRNRRNEQ